MSSSHNFSEAPSTSAPESLTGVVERITYHSEESGYTIARLKPPAARDLVTIVGNFANIQAGQTLKLIGFWKEHPQYGLQFQVTRYEETKPATLTGIEKYLGSGLIKGVGPVTAKRIVTHFGLETLNVIENHIDRLIEVPGIAKKRIAKIQSAWEAQKAIKDVMVFLQGHGVSTTYAVKIFKTYGNGAIATVTNNPYQLAADIYGIGFITADKIARQLGIPTDSPERYRAGILYLLSEATEDGHCFLPLGQLIDVAVKQLTIDTHQPDPAHLQEIVSQMATQQQLYIEESAEKAHPPLCYSPAFFHTEQNLAAQLIELLAHPVTADLPRVRNWILRFTQSRGIELSEQQQQAVEMAASSRVMILTGGPGCGKTFSTRTIVSLWKAMGKSIALAAPTGRAAQRLSEMTGMEAKTLHRLLEFDPLTMSFKRDRDNLLPFDAIVVDEASMLDLFLANSLIKAVSLNAQLLFVGDTDQLPSVGPGNVLQDLIASNKVPVVRLTQVFRQAAQSAIIRAAHSINQGDYPTIESVSPTPQSDCLWIGAPEPEHGIQAICELIDDLIPKFGYDPATDVQVLSPMTRGVVGTRNLNQVLQELINPPSPAKAEIVRGGTTLRVGDRVIQQINDYDREVFNGDLGAIAEIDPEEQEVTVQYAAKTVIYDLADLNEIGLAWAVTIHKCVAGYGLASVKGYGLVPVKDVAIGLEVQTGIGGYQQVLDHIQTGEKPILRVRTKNGYAIDVSAEHPLLVASSAEYPHFRRADTLEPGMFACIDRSLVSGQVVSLPPIQYQKTQKHITVPTHLTEDLAWALGVIVGNGSYRDQRDGTIKVSSQDGNLIHKYRLIFEGFGLTVSVRAKKNHDRIYFSSKPLRYWLESLGLDYISVSNKKTPHVIFSASVELRAAYLRGLFDTDGAVGKTNVRFTCASDQLAREVHTLLLSLGIISVLSSHQKHYKVTINGTSIIPFQQRVSFVLERKSCLLSVLVDKASKKGKGNNDIIPFGAKFIQEFKETLKSEQGKKGQGLKANRNSQGCFIYPITRCEIRATHAHLQKIANLSLSSGKSLPYSLEKTLATNYFYDRITSIEYLQRETMMYDLEIDGFHSFTVNGFVCHNSQGSEYPVVLMPLYTQHYLMLNRNLVYTGLTRAKSLAILVGPKKAVAIALRQVNDTQRYTRLRERLIRAL